MTETLTTSQVRDMLGLASNRAARVQLTVRWGLAAVGRDVETGEKLWPAGPVRERIAARPGRGARTDLRIDRLEES